MAKQNAAPHRILPEAAKPFISIRPEISKLFELNHFWERCWCSAYYFLSNHNSLFWTLWFDEKVYLISHSVHTFFLPIRFYSISKFKNFHNESNQEECIGNNVIQMPKCEISFKESSFWYGFGILQFPQKISWKE